MSKQFHMYLLPADVESLIRTLRSRLHVSLFQPWSPSLIPVSTESALCKGGLQLITATVRADCYLARNGAEIRMKFIRNLSRWNIDTDPEVIEFSGCEFDGQVLVRGRLYFHNDLHIDDTLAPKRKGFLDWADKVFRLTKKSLTRSKTLDAYLGENAEKWRQKGGRFAWTANSKRGPIYAVEVQPMSDKTRLDREG
jgi:hypothetical protein